LPRETQQFGGGDAIVVRQFNGGFDAHLFDDIGGGRDQFF